MSTSSNTSSEKNTKEKFLSQESTRKLIKTNGFLVLLLTITLSLIQPQKPVKNNPGKIQTTIIGLELAQTPQEIENLLGKPKSTEGQQSRKQFKAATYIDFAYMFSYGLLFLGIGGLLYSRKKMTKNNFIIFAVVLTFAVLTDVIEDYFLFQILRSPDMQITSSLAGLKIFTYLKWEALALASAIVAMGFWVEKIRIATYIFGFSFLTGFIGLFVREAIEIQGLLLGLGWMITWYKSLSFKTFGTPWWTETK